MPYMNFKPLVDSRIPDWSFIDPDIVYMYNTRNHRYLNDDEVRKAAFDHIAKNIAAQKNYYKYISKIINALEAVS